MISIALTAPPPPFMWLMFDSQNKFSLIDLWVYSRSLPGFGITGKCLFHTFKKYMSPENLPVIGEEYIWSFEYNELETSGEKHLHHSSVWYASSIYSQPQLLMLQIGSENVSSLFQIDEALKPQVLENYLKENSALIYFVCGIN